MGWLGAAMLAAFVLLLLPALPRGGEGRSFLRGELRAPAYAVVLVGLLMAGAALILGSWN